MKIPHSAARFFVLTLSLLCFFTNCPAQDFSGELGETKGTVEILRDGETEWLPVEDGMPVQLKDRLKTGEESFCNLELDDGSIIYVGENSEASIEMLELTAEKHDSKISLWLGKIIANVSKMKDTKMEIHSPTAIVAVRGTEFAVDSTAEKTEVGVFEGAVGVKNTEGPAVEEVTVKPEEETTVQKGRRPLPPSRLILMQKYRERNLGIRKRVAVLRERLKRMPPEKRIKARQLALERFRQMKAKRLERIENNRQKRRALKRDAIKRERLRRQ